MMSKKEIQLLCVEDNLGDQYLIREFLLKNDRINYQLTESTYLSQACQYARESAYDICLLDLSLPDSQGLQTLQDFRFHAPNLPIIILTDHDNEQFELDAIALGAQDYLIKSQINQTWLNRTIHTQASIPFPTKFAPSSSWTTFTRNTSMWVVCRSLDQRESPMRRCLRQPGSSTK